MGRQHNKNKHKRGNMTHQPAWWHGERKGIEHIKPIDITPNKWSTGEAPKKCENCDFAKDEDYRILIQPQVMSAIFAMCRIVTQEWQMMLIGKCEGSEVVITDYWVPKQTVTYTTVKNEELIDANVIRERGIIATIHSHANMQVFFSQVDDEYTNLSHIKHHLVVNNKHDFVATTRVDLPCGMVKFMKTTVHTSINELETVDGITNVKGMNHLTSKGWTNGRGTEDAVKDDAQDVVNRRDFDEHYEGYFAHARSSKRRWALNPKTQIYEPIAETGNSSDVSYID